ncbi:hypothetical protein ABZ922_04490 [Streptomyces shenzhenensis]|uniref:hypothetical protein n=1 Tax=Streptomyces shenzhenensis TaxID=943815 RepID=UPI0033D96625
MPTPIGLPGRPEPRSDPLVSDDGALLSLLDGRRTWQSATLSDVQFTADNPALSQVATAAVRRIRATRPDLIVLNAASCSRRACPPVSARQSTRSIQSLPPSG